MYGSFVRLFLERICKDGHITFNKEVQSPKMSITALETKFIDTFSKIFRMRPRKLGAKFFK